MGFLKHFRSKSRLKSKPAEEEHYPPTPRAPDPTRRLSRQLLARVFSYVCPHVTDESYEVSERSLVGSGCNLCDLRDLASCARINRLWYSVAQDLLYVGSSHACGQGGTDTSNSYHSVRIDAVHFCPLEEELSERRRKKHVDPAQIPATRLRLFQATVWKNQQLAQRVLFFKLPYMTRETCKADLARTVTALPNLKHVDLPEGFFSADPSTQILRDELQTSCMELRKMAYYAGAEQSFEALAHYRLWMNLESLDLKQLDIELTALRMVLASLPMLQEVKLRDMPKLDDAAFQSTPNLPDFPALPTLRIENAPGITADGLNAYLARPDAREVLSNLSLTKTGVTVPSLHRFIGNATALHHLSVTEVVSKTFPLDPTPPITSTSLQTFNFEVSSAEQLGPGLGALTRSSDSYYSYLAQCLHANALPTLRRLFVRDSNFPELLLYPPPGPAFATPGAGFNQTLEVFTKGPEDLDWVYTPFAPQAPDVVPTQEELLPPSVPAFAPRQSFVPPYARQSYAHQRGASASTIGRPISAYNASLKAGGSGPAWGLGEARKSVVMGDGQGGFLEVPQPPVMPAAMQEVSRPRSAGGAGSSRPGSSGGWKSAFARPGSSGGGLRPGSVGGSGWTPGHGKTDSRKSSRGDLWR